MKKAISIPLTRTQLSQLSPLIREVVREDRSEKIAIVAQVYVENMAGDAHLKCAIVDGDTVQRLYDILKEYAEQEGRECMEK